MEHPQENSFESIATPERGANVSVRIDLLRHPEKDYETGKLTDAGKSALVEKLRAEYAEGDYQTVKCYVSSLSRGKESMEPITEFLNKEGIATVPRVRDELMGRATEVGSKLKEEVTKLIEEKSSVKVPIDSSDRPVFEPPSKDFETAANEILIRDFFDKNFPDSVIGGKDVGEEINSFIRHLAELSRRLKNGSKVKFVLISHSGLIEHFVKLIYLRQHPEKKAEDVGVDDVGGLVDYMNGPRISLVSDGSGNQKAQIEWKGLVMDYPLE